MRGFACLQCGAVLTAYRIVGDEWLMWVRHGDSEGVFREANVNHDASVLNGWLTRLHQQVKR